MDKNNIDKLIKKKTKAANSISCGISWIDGRIIFKHAKKWSMFWYGICNFSRGVWAITPRDFDKPTMITTIMVSPTEDYCERSFVCLNTSCPLNRFDRDMYVAEFKDVGEFSLGMPANFGESVPWFNSPEWINLWARLVIPKEGGKLEFNEEFEDIGD